MEEIKRVTNEDILTVIQAAGANGITAREIADFFGFRPENVYAHITRLTKEGLVTKGGNNANRRYFATDIDNPEEPQTEQQEPADVRIDDPAPEPSKHKPNQNHEGYNDPTATEAIKRMENSNGFMPGGVYKTQTGSLFLVARIYPDTILGYNVDLVQKAVDTDTEVTWKIGANTAIIHTNRITSVPYKKLLLSTMQKCPFETLRDVIRKSPFSQCKTVEIPVEVKVLTDEAKAKIEDLEKQVKELEDTSENYRTVCVTLKNKHEDFAKDICDTLAIQPYVGGDNLMDKLTALHQYEIEMQTVLDELWSAYGFPDYGDVVLDDLKPAIDDRIESLRTRADTAASNAYSDIGNQIRDALGLSDDECPNDWRSLMVMIHQYKDLAEAPINPADFGVDRAEFAAMKARYECYKEVADKFIMYYTS